MGIVLLALSWLGCGAPYLMHVGAGQVRLLLDRERITPEVEARLTQTERQGLEALRRAAAFGEKIGLRSSTSHRHLVDRDGKGLVEVVTAAPRDRLEPVTWWFPIVGRVAYRGYFDAEHARRFADSLEEEGLDTYVRPARLYSTLGWFDDPVPRELLRSPPFDVADTILHERVHETIFVADDSAYNEGIAVFVSHAAVLRLYAGEPGTAQEAARAFRDQERFARLVAELAEELEALYDRAPPMETLLRERDVLFARYRTTRFEAVDWETPRYGGFPEVPFSNAWVVATRTYLGDLPCFAAELESHGDDLEAFVRAHREAPGRRADEDGSCPFEGTREP